MFRTLYDRTMTTTEAIWSQIEVHPHMNPRISVVIPAFDAERFIPRCLAALKASSLAAYEIIVVDDGSADDTRQIATSLGATVLSTEGRCGPAFARNLGAKAAGGNILFFIDADVCVHTNTIQRVANRFIETAGLDAVIGSYDHTPSEGDFVSQYRNLMHAYVHHTGAERASTFWSGCGAIRRDLFLEHSGFNEMYGRPAIEDIELGYRLASAGHNLLLDRSIEVTHLKRWTFFNLLRTDILDRGIPWTELILRDQNMPNDLNLQLSQRVSVALVFLLMTVSAVLAVHHGGYILIPFFVVVYLLLARWWVEVGSHRRPRSASLALVVMVGAIAVLAWMHQMPGIIAPLILTPALLLIRHRYRKQYPTLESGTQWYRRLGILYVCSSLIIALYYFPVNHLVYVCIAILALIGILNVQFYMFLAGKRGLAFMLAAIPFHLLYHFYNGLSFIIGTIRHYTHHPSSTVHVDPPEEDITQPPSPEPPIH